MELIRVSELNELSKMMNLLEYKIACITTGIITFNVNVEHAVDLVDIHQDSEKLVHR